MPDKSLTEVCVITSAHGVRGQVKLKSFTQPPDALITYGTLSDKTGTREFSVTLHGGTDRGLIASIKGITDRNQAELLRGTVLYANAENVPVTLEDQLTSLPARLADGSAYGTITGLFNFGAGDIIEIEKPDGKSEMLPLSDAFVEIKDDHVLVHPPEWVEGKK